MRTKDLIIIVYISLIPTLPVESFSVSAASGEVQAGSSSLSSLCVSQLMSSTSESQKTFNGRVIKTRIDLIFNFNVRIYF